MECDCTFSWFPLHVHLGGDSPCRRSFLLGITHLVVGSPFRYRGCTERQRFDKAVIMKEADVWP